MTKTEKLAQAIEDNLDYPKESTTVEYDFGADEIFVRCHVWDADTVFTVAHDFGWTPNGVIISDSWTHKDGLDVGDLGVRLRPREDSEQDIEYDPETLKYLAHLG